MATTTLFTAGATLSAPTSQPLFIPGLPVSGAVRRYITKYLTASAGAAVSSLPDFGSEGVPLTQATTSRQPLVALDSGIKTLAFDGTDDSLAAAFTAQTPISTEALTMYAVVKLPAFTGSQRIPLWLANRRFVIAATQNQLTAWGVTTGAGILAYTPGWHFVSLQMKPDGTIRDTLDGISSSPGVVTGTTANQTIAVGGASATDSSFASQIQVAELGVFRGTTNPLTDQNIADIRTAMKAAYPFLP